MADRTKRLPENVPGEFFVDSTCIDCDACVPECPVEAVFAEANVPPEWAHFTQMNAEKSLSGLPTITARLDPLCESVSPTH